MKTSEIDTENDKIPKLSIFQSCYAILTDFKDWNVENGHQSKNLVFRSLL